MSKKSPPTEKIVSIEELPAFHWKPAAWEALVKLAISMASELPVGASERAPDALNEVRVGVPDVDDRNDLMEFPKELVSALAKEYAFACEGQASRAINQLVQMALGGNPYAARALHGAVSEAVWILNSVARKNIDTFRPIGEKAIGWPIIHSDMLDETARNAELLKDLHVGEKSPIRAFKLATKSLRWTEGEGLNRYLVRLFGNLSFLNAAATCLSQDNPPHNEFERRCDALLPKWQPDGETSGVHAMLMELREGGFPETKARFAKMVSKWLKIDSGGHIERIRELRISNINKEVSDRDTNNRIAAVLKRGGIPNPASKKGVADQGIRDWLKENIGHSDVEDEIGNQIRKNIKASLNWLNFP